MCRLAQWKSSCYGVTAMGFRSLGITHRGALAVSRIGASLDAELRDPCAGMRLDLRAGNCRAMTRERDRQYVSFSGDAYELARDRCLSENAYLYVSLFYKSPL